MSDGQDPHQQFPEDDGNIVDELKAQFFAFAIYGLIALFFYGFVQFLASFEPKVRLKYDDIPVEQRLEQLPSRFSYFYQQAQLGFSTALPTIKYWDFRWQHQKMSYKLFQFSIAEQNMTEQQFMQNIMPRLIAQGWTLLTPPYEEEVHLAPADFIFLDTEHNRLFVTKPMHNKENPQYWQVSFVENSGIYEYLAPV
ncbi:MULTISPECIES: hypothetical protein [Acinetobacter]|uniref:Uncharacterized protein n=1 Tax=Acinetobacter piscicola TaxID=2006115 RepID=A0A7S6VXD8_9GAMM|nr:MULTISPECIES: hypothetical protein [Acinetobacter]QOW46645.1 hypothetical protein G0028_12485 [Acinetobacter piscicola]